MDKLKALLNLLNRKQFFIKKCGFKENSGVSKWINGKPTNERAKKTELDEGDKAKIKEGLKLLVDDINQVIEIL